MEEKDKFNSSRRKFILGGAILGVVLASAKVGQILSGKTLQLLKKKPILPPGAESYEKFVSKCISCGICVKNCPGKVIKEADFEYNTIHMDFKSGKCDYNCTVCNQICPSWALKKLKLEEKQNTKIGIAKLDSSKCIGCENCISQCPKGALKITENLGKKTPNINSNLCIGCGVCENICPANAIKIEPLV